MSYSSNYDGTGLLISKSITPYLYYYNSITSTPFSMITVASIKTIIGKSKTVAYILGVDKKFYIQNYIGNSWTKQ